MNVWTDTWLYWLWVDCLSYWHDWFRLSWLLWLFLESLLIASTSFIEFNIWIDWSWCWMCNADWLLFVFLSEKMIASDFVVYDARNTQTSITPPSLSHLKHLPYDCYCIDCFIAENDWLLWSVDFLFSRKLFSWNFFCQNGMHVIIHDFTSRGHVIRYNFYRIIVIIVCAV